MNILLLAWHETFTYNFCKIGHSFFVIEPKVLGLRRIDGHSTWQFQYRPLPENAQIISDLETLRAQLQGKAIDCAIALNVFDLAFYKNLPIKKIYAPISFYNDDISMYKSTAPSYHKLLRDHIIDLIKGYSPVFYSKRTMEKELEGTDIKAQVLDEEKAAVFDPSDYHTYSGEIAEVLRVGHHLKDRDYYRYDLQSKALEGIPHLVLGHNPGVPNARLSKSWDDLRDCLRKYRLFFATYSSDYNLPDPLSQLEAMATGMPVVTTPHPTCMVTDGVNGFVSDDPRVLRDRIFLLLSDRELAYKLGQNGRRMILEKYTFEGYKQEWNRVLQGVCEKPSVDAKVEPVSSSSRKSFEWEGPFIYGEQFEEFNCQIVLALEKKNVAVFPIPKGAESGGEAQSANLLQHMTFLETLGKSLSVEKTSPNRVVSPYTDTLSKCDAAYFHWNNDGFPQGWLDAYKAGAVEKVWVGSFAEAMHYEAHGIKPEDLRVVQPGIEPLPMELSESKMAYESKKQTVFLFSGNATPLQGGNLAIDAYLSEFCASEDVSFLFALTIPSESLSQHIATLKRDGKNPEIDCIYDDTIALFGSPFRAATFSIVPHCGLSTPRFLPKLIASGYPFVVSGFGAALDLERWGTSYFIPTLLEEPFLGVPDVQYLRKLLRYVYQNPDLPLLRALIARRKGIEQRSWSRIADQIMLDLPLNDSKKKSIYELARLQECQYWLDCARVHLLLMEWQRAEECVLKALAINQESGLAKAVLAEAYLGMGNQVGMKILEAKVVSQEIMDCELTHLIKGASYGDWTSGLEKIIERCHDTHQLLLCVLALMESGRLSQARSLCNKIKENTNEPIAFVMLGLLWQNEDWVESHSHYESAMEMGPFWENLAPSLKREFKA